MSRRGKKNRPQSRVELVSDGTMNGSHVYLVVSDGKVEQRFEIPNVITAELNIGGDHGGSRASKEPILILGIGKPFVEVHVGIGHGRSSVEDLLAEVAAAKLRSSDR